jgi:hypothetical protein
MKNINHCSPPSAKLARDADVGRAKVYVNAKPVFFQYQYAELGAFFFKV